MSSPVLSPRSSQAQAAQTQFREMSRRVRHRSFADGKDMYFGKYVSQEGSEKLLTYEYHGSDNSLIYKHVLTPMNNYLVELLPLWLAPNLVRMAASVCRFWWSRDGHCRSVDHADRPAARGVHACAVLLLLPVPGRRGTLVAVHPGGFGALWLPSAFEPGR